MHTPIHILFVLAGGGQGGGPTIVLQLIEALMKDGRFQISLVTDPGSYAAESARELGVQVYTIPMMHSRFSKDTTQQLKKLFSTCNATIIHAHGSRSGFYAARAGAQRIARFIYTVHGYHFIAKPYLLRQFALLIECFTNLHAHVITNVGYNEYNLAKKYRLVSKNKTHITIPLGVSKDISLTFDPKRYTQKHVVYLGRLSPEKRPEFCLEVFKYLKLHAFRLTFIGGGPLQAQIEQSIQTYGWQDLVHCTGFLSQTEAVHLLQDKSVLLLPSKGEGMPVSILEGYAYGMPAIGARVHGINEAIQDGVTGYTMATQDPEAYAQAIIRMHDDPALYASFVRAGQAMLSTYSQQQFFARYIQLFLDQAKV